MVQVEGFRRLVVKEHSVCEILVQGGNPGHNGPARLAWNPERSVGVAVLDSSTADFAAPAPGDEHTHDSSEQHD